MAFDQNAETTVAFVARCSGACTLAYQLAAGFGLPQPLWAAISAVVVSQERFSDTRSSLTSRIAGTVLGVAISLVVGAVAAPMKLSAALQIAVAVALAAYATHRFPTFRAAMWTCPLVLLTGDASNALIVVALRRASEVICGAAVAFAFHWAIEKIWPATAKPGDPVAPSK